MNKSILFSILYLTSELTKAVAYFEVIFQESGKWSPRQIAEYKGHIPSIPEFTACHWEKMQYFATRSNTIWSYCKVYSTNDKILTCIQLYSYGLESTAYRSISYNRLKILIEVMI